MDLATELVHSIAVKEMNQIHLITCSLIHLFTYSLIHLLSCPLTPYAANTLMSHAKSCDSTSCSYADARRTPCHERTLHWGAVFLLLATTWLAFPSLATNTMTETSPSPAPASHQVLLEDFSGVPQDRWEFIADTVMGGVSSGTVQFLSIDGKGLLKLSGTVSTANNGGFIQARLPLDQTATNPLPANAQGIWLKTRGNGQKYFVHVRTSGTLLPWQYYQASFEATRDWQVIELPWGSFNPSGGLSGSLLRDEPRAQKVKSIAIVAFGRDHEADVEVAEIGYY